MTWAKVDDHANEHRKQLAAGAEACWLWTCGLMYANRQAARDGFIPDAALGMLYPFKAATKLALKLVEVRLWHRVEGGYLIHEFTSWNQTKEQREHALSSGRDRAARSYALRAKNQNSSGEESPKTPTEENAVLQNSSGSIPTPTPTPTPLPVRDPPTPSVFAPQGADRDISAGDLGSFAPDPAVISRPQKTREKKPNSTQWRRFPPDFEPDESHRQLATQLGLNLAQQLAEIRDHQFAKPKSDAAATLRTWLRNAPKFGAPALGASRRIDPRAEVQDRNAQHDAQRALRSSQAVRELMELK